MVSLARRNLFHDKVRLTVTLTGIVFAIVLISVQLGLFIGFTVTTSGLIDHANADLWVVARGIRNIDYGTPFSEGKLYQVLSTPGVVDAEKYIVQFVNWKRPDGRQEVIEIVGFDPDGQMGKPWDVAQGKISDLKMADAVFVDKLYKHKLGIHQLWQEAEINGHRARVAGYTRGIRAFTTSPYVFTSFKNALNYARVGPNETIYLLVKARAGTDLADLKKRLQERLPDQDVYTTAEFSAMTHSYWIFTTGAGGALFMAAGLGLIVGVVVVAQTIYATTMDHLKEFGTLKAMGASNGYLYNVIIRQAVIAATLGYLLSMGVSALIIYATRENQALIVLPAAVAVSLYFLALFMCVAASILSINTVTRIDPAMVFKG